MTAINASRLDSLLGAGLAYKAKPAAGVQTAGSVQPARTASTSDGKTFAPLELRAPPKPAIAAFATPAQVAPQTQAQNSAQTVTAKASGGEQTTARGSQALAATTPFTRQTLSAYAGLLVGALDGGDGALAASDDQARAATSETGSASASTSATPGARRPGGLLNVTI